MGRIGWVIYKIFTTPHHLKKKKKQTNKNSNAIGRVAEDDI